MGPGQRSAASSPGRRGVERVLHLQERRDRAKRSAQPTGATVLSPRGRTWNPLTPTRNGPGARPGRGTRANGAAQLRVGARGRTIQEAPSVQVCVQETADRHMWGWSWPSTPVGRCLFIAWALVWAGAFGVEDVLIGILAFGVVLIL